MKVHKYIFIKICLIGLLFSFSFGKPDVLDTDEQVSVSKVTVTFYGNPATSKGFTWYTSLASTNSDLQLIEKLHYDFRQKYSHTAQATDILSDSRHAMQFSGKCFSSTNSSGENVHKAEAGNLKPATSYYFRVGDAALGIWSEVGIFRTAAVQAPFTFIHLSDTQAGTENEAVLSAATLAKALVTVPNARFIVHSGDVTENGLYEQHWNWLLSHAQPSLLNTTIVPASGNHDAGTNSFFEHFNIEPARDCNTATGAYYSFDYGNAHFIVLNTNEDSAEYATLSSAQIQWLRNDAAAARKAGADWLIVNMHKGPYTISLHATGSAAMGDNGLRTRFAPLLSELGVDLVLQGHDHLYSRTKPINNGVAVETAKLSGIYKGITIEYARDPAGTIYLNPGTAGAKVYYKNSQLSAKYYSLFDYADEHHAAVYGYGPPRGIVQNFVKITVGRHKLTAIAYEIDQNKNNAEPYVIDSFGIIKSSVRRVKTD